MKDEPNQTTSTDESMNYDIPTDEYRKSRVKVETITYKVVVEGEWQDKYGGWNDVL